MTAKLYQTTNKVFRGCDFVIQLGKDCHCAPIKLLQLTDMQFIDATQRRSPDRLRNDEIIAWHPDNFMAQCGNHIASLIVQTKPDLIFITGDIVYGSFDDNGTTLEWFCSFMDSFEIPWAPTFGNHDNESAKGVDWQCAQFENSKYCVFRRGNVSGNSNYSVGIAVGDELVRVLHMIDSNGCVTNHSHVISKAGIYPDQLALIDENTQAIQKSQGHLTPCALIRLLKAIKKPKVLDLGLIGVLPEYQAKGISSAMIAKIMDMLTDGGIEYAETNLNLETNTKIQNQWKSFDSVLHKRRRAFVKKI